MGEIRALRVRDVKPDHIEMRRSWERGYGPRLPKADSVRDVPISPRVHGILARVLLEAQPTSLVFYGKAGRDTPLAKSCIEGHLARALEAVGIPVMELRERDLTFHAWRHFLDSLLRSRGVHDARSLIDVPEPGKVLLDTVQL